MKTWNFSKHLMSCAAIFIFLFIIAKILLPIGTSVCIIGGADGPTTIYLTNEPIFDFETIIILILFIIAIILYKPIKRYIKK
ncbi:hypothetical protein SAMN05660649_00700 [Desulfotomaculum arcticum]|uniref:Uncharacterized protein n=1 Tax=Desulfotruncus arcticus DSM 17038 TaxID=1121424 RepID=A0A1I2P9W1_9FIRM|nr:hypothetical protein [Desulfotruncus arcticus]SFG10747.1 hypothetical protein SAMN05660649_00700 [Desulfotomaculum arcticum] [Desulfotruncus arcticus DSM 17038]